MVKEQLLLLAGLEEIDNKIKVYEDNLVRLPNEAQEIARKLVVVRREISEAEERLAATKKDLRKKEQDLETEQEKIRRSERRLQGIKNQKEYNALSREVKLGKKVASELEESILKLMAESESLTRFIDKKKVEYQAAEEELARNKAEAEEISKEAEEALDVLRKERSDIVDSVEASFIKKYQTVRNALGSAVAEMQNGSCSACHMSVPPQLNIKILKQEELIDCPTCHRILYVRPENIPEYNKID